jgi:hypothetical protein
MRAGVDPSFTQLTGLSGGAAVANRQRAKRESRRHGEPSSAEQLLHGG